MSGNSLVKNTIVMKVEEHTIEIEPRLNIVTSGKTTVKFDIASTQLIYYKERELYKCSQCSTWCSYKCNFNEY